MKRVKGSFGFLLLGMAVWMLQRVVPASLVLALWGALLIGLSMTFVYMLTQVIAGKYVLLSVVALLLGVLGGAMEWGAAIGEVDPRQMFVALVNSASPTAVVAGAPVSLPFDTISSPQMLQARLDLARKKAQPVLVDFFADWCVSCHSIDREVFGDPQVYQALAGVQLLRVDVTSNSEELRTLMLKNQVQGPPTVMFFDTQGRERRDARLVGEFATKDLLQRLAALLPMPTGHS